jgi:GT2 family glycosyltransferase
MLNASIVLYNPNWEQVVSLTNVILQAEWVDCVYWIDNSPNPIDELPISSNKLKYIFNNKNIGYGAAHNIAIRESIYDDIPFHLIINPDIILTPDTIATLLQFIQPHPEIGMVVPKVVYPNGELQYLCKLLPTPMDVFGRRFLPKSWIKQRNEIYELHQTGYDKIMNIPYLSGCFMLLRTEAVRKARLFDERFFMYPEDIDLTRRIHQDYLTVFYPHVTIIHNHEKASYKSWKMLWIHIVNMCRYFNKWGWVFDKERRMVNRITKQEYLPESQTK